MSWNYRITKEVYNHKYLAEPETIYGVREVYYDDNEDIVNFSEKPIIIGDSLQEVKDTLTRMIECCDKPVLDYNTGENIQEAN